MVDKSIPLCYNTIRRPGTFQINHKNAHQNPLSKRHKQQAEWTASGTESKRHKQQAARTASGTDSNRHGQQSAQTTKWHKRRVARTISCTNGKTSIVKKAKISVKEYPEAQTGA